MTALITVTATADVAKEVKKVAETWPVWDSNTHVCDPPDSGKFPFDYSKQEERVLIVCGKAILTPDDGSADVTIGTGDYVIFHKGFSCRWHVLEPMQKHYCYFDEEGNEAKCAGGISCDLCSKDCSAESFLMDGEVDLCPDCYAEKGTEYKLAQRCVDGAEVGKPSKPKKTAPAPANSNKKSAAKKAVAPKKAPMKKR
mmetsp:Transcript_70411/g.114401  ORF Transcript_70411/g.114401 Transcript_70411/m.114401 type:complete len:198 (+) Transcript_70411:3-596(+)